MQASPKPSPPASLSACASPTKASWPRRRAPSSPRRPGIILKARAWHVIYNHVDLHGTWAAWRLAGRDVGGAVRRTDTRTPAARPADGVRRPGNWSGISRLTGLHQRCEHGARSLVWLAPVSKFHVVEQQDIARLPTKEKSLARGSLLDPLQIIL